MRSGGEVDSLRARPGEGRVVMVIVDNFREVWLRMEEGCVRTMLEERYRGLRWKKSFTVVCYQWKRPEPSCMLLGRGQWLMFISMVPSTGPSTQ